MKLIGSGRGKRHCLTNLNAIVIFHIGLILLLQLMTTEMWHVVEMLGHIVVHLWTWTKGGVIIPANNRMMARGANFNIIFLLPFYYRIMIDCISWHLIYVWENAVARNAAMPTVILLHGEWIFTGAGMGFHMILFRGAMALYFVEAIWGLVKAPTFILDMNIKLIVAVAVIADIVIGDYLCSSCGRGWGGRGWGSFTKNLRNRFVSRVT